MAGGKTKVAILGGGVGAVTCAFALTDSQELRDRYDVTVYQLGWRLGGKGASGRNASIHDRIEEHGLHIWFGCYDNAFTCLRSCYDQLARPADVPIRTIEDAFHPSDVSVLFEQHRDWFACPAKFPENAALPGTPGELPTFWNAVALALEDLENQWEKLRHGTAPVPVDDEVNHSYSFVHRLIRAIGHPLEAVADGTTTWLLHLAAALARHEAGHDPYHHNHEHHGHLARLLHSFRSWLYRHELDRHRDDDSFVHFVYTVDVIAAALAGAHRDRVLLDGFDAINDYELREWLLDNGAERESVERAVLVRSQYSGCFSFLDGDVTKPNIAAGAAFYTWLREPLAYRGAAMWKMQAGMGDTIFAPYYELLAQRGVTFEFFKAVQRLGVGDDRLIDTVDIVDQVRLADESASYQPLRDVHGLPCWPNEPLWAQLHPDDVAAIHADGANLEFDSNPLDRPVRTLRRGDDYDIVVLGISVAALPTIAAEVALASPRFAQMLDASRTVVTQAFQVWLDRDVNALGWPHGSCITSTYVEPMDTWCDMGHLISRETWTDAERPAVTVGYFCGVVAESPVPTSDTAKANAIEHLEHEVFRLWPNIATNGTFDWNAAVDDENREGRDRFDAQYWRVNTAPSERYVLSPAGSIKHRLRADESGIENLIITGDWVRNGLDLGSVEAATMAGLQAARAISGLPTAVPRETHTWLCPTAPEHRVRTPDLPSIS